MNWKTTVIDEPLLSFGGGNCSYDIREGIQKFGPVDADGPRAKTSIRVGIVGTPKTIAAFKEWMEICNRGIAGHDELNPNLHPAFPGLSSNVGLRCLFVSDPSWESIVTEAEIKSEISKPGAILALASLFHQHITALYKEASAKPDVVVCLPSDSVRKIVKPRFDDELDEDAKKDESEKPPDFHDYLKGLCLQSHAVFQLVWPRTYSPSAKGVQDPATRAWNLFGALFYKAGGIPWKLEKTPGGHNTCYVGISFAIRPEGGAFHSCLTQVFNDRGEGTILKGGLAKKSMEDFEYHLSEESSERLLSEAFASFSFANNKKMPERIVIHKSSGYDDAELKGFNAAAEKHSVRFRDFLALRDSALRLFRVGSYPPLRGTHLILDEANSLLYTRGSIPFYRKYPGPYVPRSMHIRYYQTDSDQSDLAQEILALTKLNWNKTQFDSFYPITLGGSKRIAEIYQWCPDAPSEPISYSFSCRLVNRINAVFRFCVVHESSGGLMRSRAVCETLLVGAVREGSAHSSLKLRRANWLCFPDWDVAFQGWRSLRELRPWLPAVICLRLSSLRYGSSGDRRERRAVLRGGAGDCGAPHMECADHSALVLARVNVSPLRGSAWWWICGRGVRGLAPTATIMAALRAWGVRSLLRRIRCLRHRDRRTAGVLCLSILSTRA